MALVGVCTVAEQRTKTSGARRRADGAIEHRDHKHCRDKLHARYSDADHPSRWIIRSYSTYQRGKFRDTTVRESAGSREDQAKHVSGEESNRIDCH